MHYAMLTRAYILPDGGVTGSVSRNEESGQRTEIKMQQGKENAGKDRKYCWKWQRERKEVSRADKIVFTLLLLVYTGVMLYLFLMQCYQVPDFISDMPAYVDKVAGISGEYEFPYPLFFSMAKIFSLFLGAPAAVAVTTALLNSLGVWVTKLYMNRAIKAWTGMYGSGKLDLSVTFAVFALFLLGNLYSPKNTAFFGFDYAYRCMGIYTPNPIWNATYLATRPFAVICFFEGCRMLRAVDALWKEKAGGGGSFAVFPWKDSIPFAVSLFLTTITKPSFTLVVVPAMGLLLLVQLIRSRGKSFSYAVCLCVTMIPTGLDLLYQFFGVFSGTNVYGEETGIGFAFGKVWSSYSNNIPLSIVMGMALPMGVLVLNLKDFRKDAYYRFAWFNYAVSAVMFLCLYEKGFRMLHANFSWGYMHGMFFVFLITLVYVIKNTIQWRKSYKVIFVLAEWAVLFYHLACGVNFLAYALQGKDLAGF